jgi:hypothetical protein
MTDQELKALVADLLISQAKTDAQMAKTDAQMAKTDAQMAKTDAKLDRLAKMYGGIADNMGSSAEEYFYNSLNDSKQIGRFQFDIIYERIKGGSPGSQQEYDLVLVNGTAVALVEVKYKVHLNVLDQVDKQLRSFKQHFPEYQHMQLYGGIAGFSVPDDVVQAAHDKGFFVLKRSGDSFSVDADSMRAVF